MIDFTRFPSLCKVLDSPAETVIATNHITPVDQYERQQGWEAFLLERGERYRPCRLANFEITSAEQQQVVRSLREYAESMAERVAAGQNIVLVGTVGTGKDHLVAAMVRAAVLSYGLEVIWRSGPTLQREFRRAIHDDGTEHEDSIIRHLVQCDVLALSDPGGPTGTLTPYQTTTLYSIIDARYSHLRPTWITVNVASSVEADAALGAPVVDRLRDGALVLPCVWRSHRRPTE